MVRAIALVVVALIALTGRLSAQNAAATVWVQYEADGLPHVRAIVASAPCPTLNAGADRTPLAQRAPSQPGFPDIVCDAVLSPDTRGASVAGVALPRLPHAPGRIAIFADTGCRLKGAEVQACNDPIAWPFPAIARDIANARPDLVIHVGDYYYRETPCPAAVNCANSPYGDNTGAWIADYFAPMASVFTAAPIVNVRGNHEDCKRSPLGWARYLAGTPAAQCTDHELPSYVTFDDLVLAVVDDATEVTETLADAPVYAADAALVDARAVAVARETWLLVHRPPVTYEYTHENGTTAIPHVAAVFSGHLHLFGAYTLPAEPPQIITGMGGDNLASSIETTALGVLGGVTDARFGYALFERRTGGWDITVHDVDTNVHRRCRLEARNISCGPALT